MTTWKEHILNTPIDLRSDTVTRPTEAMREAIANAKVGDDVMGADPSVNELESRTASMFGKEASLFVPSGTMANLLAVLAQTVAGDEILTHPENHVYYYETGGYAAIAGCSIRFVKEDETTRLGMTTPDGINRALRMADVHFPPTKLFTVENTHNRGGGIVWPMDLLRDTCKAARANGLRVHTDGARIWNASIASGVDLKDIASETDTISACLSKGLGCPVGSILVGDQDTIDRARMKRKMLGGGMRQAGVLAAAGMFALDHHFDRLAEDHLRAKELANSLASIELFDFDPASIETNLVYARLSTKAISTVGDAYEWQEQLESIGVLCYAESKGTIRFVTHLDIDDAMIHETVRRIKEITL